MINVSSIHYFFQHLWVALLSYPDTKYICCFLFSITSFNYFKCKMSQEKIFPQYYLIEKLLKKCLCCYITVDSATAASQNWFDSYKLSLDKKTNIIQIMTNLFFIFYYFHLLSPCYFETRSSNNSFLELCKLCFVCSHCQSHRYAAASKCHLNSRHLWRFWLPFLSLRDENLMKLQRVAGYGINKRKEGLPWLPFYRSSTVLSISNPPLVCKEIYTSCLPQKSQYL
jgi:hypothetical protein